MKIAEISIRRPVTTVMVYVGLLLLGGISLYRIPLEFMPKADFPLVDIQIPYAASTPDEVFQRIVRPIEEALSTLSGIDKITSRSSTNGAYLQVIFKPEANIDFEVLEIREKLDLIRDDLPDDLDVIWIWKFDSESIPIFIVGIHAEHYDAEVNDLVDRRIAQEIRRVDGAANVEVLGMEHKRILVEVDRDKLEQHGVSLMQVFQALVSNNITLDAGQVINRGRRYDVRVMGQAEGPEEIGRFSLAPNITIEDVADVKFDYTFGMMRGRIDLKRAYLIFARKESGANTVEVCRRIQKVIDDIADDPDLIEKGLHARVFFDQSREITRAVNGLRSTGIQGGILAFIVLFLFIRNIRITVIISIAIPMSIILAILLMHLILDMSFNMVSLSGLMLGIGMLVDNSIVIMEAIYSRIQDGMSPKQAAVEGSQEVGAAITVATTTTLIVFLPLIFAIASNSVVIMREFGTVLCLSVGSSLFVALTLVPLLASRLLKPGEGHTTPKWFVSFRNGYIGVLGRALDRRKVTFALAVAFFMLTYIPIKYTEREVVPETMMRLVTVTPRIYRTKSLEGIDKIVSAIEEKLFKYRDEWDIETLIAFFNRDYVEINIILPEYDPGMARNEVKRRAEKVLQEEANWPNIEYDLESMGMGGGPSIGLKVRVLGDDPDILYGLAEQVRSRLLLIPELTKVKPISHADEREINIHIDRDLAQVFDVDVTQAAYEIAYGIRGTNAGWVQHMDRQIDVVLQLQEEDRDTVDRIQNFPMMNKRGDVIPLGSFSHISSQPIPRTIRRYNRQTYINIPIEYENKDLFTLKTNITAALEGLILPRGYSWSLGDDFEEVRNMFKSLLQAIVLAIILVFLLMVAQFESFFLPFVIMFTMPFAIIGLYWSLFLTGNTLNVLSGAGVLLLAGIVVNNAIVLVDHVHNLRKLGLGNKESLLKACEDRIRPIIMTAITTMVGLAPMALGANDQGRMIYSPLAIAVLGGLFTSTMLVPMLIPVIYSLSDDVVRVVRAWGSGIRNAARK